MKQPRNSSLSIALTLALGAIQFSSVALTAAHAQTFTVLYNFGGNPGDPSTPLYGSVAQGRDGNLYGTTFAGGSIGAGTVFRITPAGIVTVLSDLGGDAGQAPLSGLTLGRDGNFYGTTQVGGSGGWGTVFKITPEGKLVVLYSFSGDMNGGNPYAAPVQGADGNLYGTTFVGGESYRGTIYKITPPQHLTTLHQFTGADGEDPYAPLLQATDGGFYGTASNYAFKISPAGVFTSLGSLPGTSEAPLIQGSDGSFFGVTFFGKTFGLGTVFRMTRAGKTRVLHSFNDLTLGANPLAGLVQATDGNLYGTTYYGGLPNYGVIYRINPSAVFSVLFSYSNDFDGGHPEATLFQHTNGILYGTTSGGGLYDGGTLFSFDVGAPPFVRLVTTFGKVGRTIGILGQSFTGTTEVSFNGIPATFTVSSDTYLEASVPTGATTGFVTVTTSTGTLTSNQQIQIR
jgi:uncharacterized repeat protein (TIGR03803 family)